MSLKKVYGPKDFGKSPLLLGFRKSIGLNQKSGTEIQIADILSPSKRKYVSEEFGVPTYWRVSRGYLRLYSEKDTPLNTRIDRTSIKKIPSNLLRDISEETGVITIKKGIFKEEKQFRKTWPFSEETQTTIKTIERPSYYFDFAVYGKTDAYWFV